MATTSIRYTSSATFDDDSSSTYVCVCVYVCVREREREHARGNRRWVQEASDTLHPPLLMMTLAAPECVCVCVGERERAREEIEDGYNTHPTHIIQEVGGWGRVPFSRNFMSPTPRRKWYLTTGRRAH